MLASAGLRRAKPLGPAARAPKVAVATARRSVSATHGIKVRALTHTLEQIMSAGQLGEIGQKGPPMASAGRRSLFHALFGRDSIRMSMDLMNDFPAVAETTILSLARLQGVQSDRVSEEEPGRIPHESRPPSDPIAQRLSRSGWRFPYYGSVDATPQFVNLVAAYVKKNGPAILEQKITDKAGREVTVRDSVAAATRFIVGRVGDPKGGGLLYVRRANPRGIPVQVWEDSGDSYYDGQGKLVDFSRPFAPVALQGYAYDALQNAADLLGSGPKSEASGVLTPARLRAEAASLRDKVLSEYWQPDLHTFALAMATDAGGREVPLRVVGSGAGHLLASSLLDGKDAEPKVHELVTRLLAPDMLCGAGIRTKSTTAPRFGAGTYHNGSSWPMDTGVFIDGLRRHGYESDARAVEDRLLRAVGQAGGFPEFFRGDADGSVAVNTKVVDRVVDGQMNRVEQPPQANQGWTATRVWKILRDRGDIELHD